jgi:hypothetical protein
MSEKMTLVEVKEVMLQHFTLLKTLAHHLSFRSESDLGREARLEVAAFCVSLDRLSAELKSEIAESVFL